MSQANPLRRGLTVVPKILNEAEGLVEYVASNETLDSYNEIVSARGWRFTRFQKNAPFVNSHRYYSIADQLGEVVSARLEGRDLIERVRWAKDIPENAMAQLGWKMTLGGFLKAVSVGFFPVRWVGAGKDGWTQALQYLGIKPEDATAIRYIYLEQEQIELSACIIGANPDALAKSWEAGAVKDEDLAKCGFTDDDMAFLKVAGKALDKPDLSEVEQLLIGREMGRIAARNQSPGMMKQLQTSDSPGKPGGGEIAERQAEERKAFLKQLGDRL